MSDKYPPFARPGETEAFDRAERDFGVQRRKVIAYRLEPVFGPPHPGRALLTCMATGKTLATTGGGSDYLAPELVDAFRTPHSEPEQLEQKHWPWLAQQLLDWPDRRTHPDKTISIGALHRMAAGVIREADKRLGPPRPPIMLEMAKASREHDEMEAKWTEQMRKATGPERDVLAYMGEVCGWPS